MIDSRCAEIQQTTGEGRFARTRNRPGIEPQKRRNVGWIKPTFCHLHARFEAPSVRKGQVTLISICRELEWSPLIPGPPHYFFFSSSSSSPSFFVCLLCVCYISFLYVLICLPDVAILSKLVSSTNLWFEERKELNLKLVNMWRFIDLSESQKTGTTDSQLA